MLLEPLKDTIVVAPNDAILECDIDVGEPESEIKWSVIFQMLIYCFSYVSFFSNLIKTLKASGFYHNLL